MSLRIEKCIIYLKVLVPSLPMVIYSLLYIIHLTKIPIYVIILYWDFSRADECSSRRVCSRVTTIMTAGQARPRRLLERQDGWRWAASARCAHRRCTSAEYDRFVTTLGDENGRVSTDRNATHRCPDTFHGFLPGFPTRPRHHPDVAA